jgi:hypothetical protein
MSDNGVFHRSPQVVFQSLGEGEDGVLLHLETAGYFSLNPLGVLIWQLLEQPAGLEAIVDGVRQAVDDAPPGLRTDVENFLGELLARELLTRDTTTS